jgi:hypothetical protein
MAGSAYLIRRNLQRSLLVVWARKRFVQLEITITNVWDKRQPLESDKFHKYE